MRAKSRVVKWVIVRLMSRRGWRVATWIALRRSDWICSILKPFRFGKLEQIGFVSVYWSNWDFVIFGYSASTGVSIRPIGSFYVFWLA